MRRNDEIQWRAAGLNLFSAAYLQWDSMEGNNTLQTNHGHMTLVWLHLKTTILIPIQMINTDDGMIQRFDWNLGPMGGCDGRTLFLIVYQIFHIQIVLSWEVHLKKNLSPTPHIVPVVTPSTHHPLWPCGDWVRSLSWCWRSFTTEQLRITQEKWKTSA